MTADRIVVDRGAEVFDDIQMGTSWEQDGRTITARWGTVRRG